MATTVISSFAEFATRLNITDRQEKIVSNCRTNVVDKLKAELELHPTQPSLLIGSYDRDTMPRYLSNGDVDVMVVLHYSKNEDWYNAQGTVNALQKFSRVLSNAFQQTPCGIDRNCVTMKLKEFRLDVVPAFYFNDGSYKIPDTYRKSWLATQPKQFSEHITQINKNMDGGFVPFVKMIKAWNNQYDTRIRSFHLECMLANSCAAYQRRYSYHSLAKVFFEGLPARLRGVSYDPVAGDRLDAYLDNSLEASDRDLLIKRAERAAKLAEEAYNQSDSNPKRAIENWKKLFGEFYPACG